MRSRIFFFKRFSRRIMTKFSKLVTKLEVTLGPDTGDLGLRIGKFIHPWRLSTSDRSN